MRGLVVGIGRLLAHAAWDTPSEAQGIPGEEGIPPFDIGVNIIKEM